MTSVSITLTALFVELAFECAVDVVAVTVEHDQGVNLDDFWKIWHKSESEVTLSIGRTVVRILRSNTWLSLNPI